MTTMTLRISSGRRSRLRSVRDDHRHVVSSIAPGPLLRFELAQEIFPIVGPLKVIGSQVKVTEYIPQKYGQNSECLLIDERRFYLVSVSSNFAIA